jgi:hypothetical protein
VHTYDVPHRQEPAGGPSATPIYDALYAEYVKSFRALPGDRSGEEELGFSAFGSSPHRPGPYGDSGSYSGYSAGAYGAGVHGTGAYSARQQQAQWQRVGRIGPQGTTRHHVPAALPPGRSDG